MVLKLILWSLAIFWQRCRVANVPYKVECSTSWAMVDDVGPTVSKTILCESDRYCVLVAQADATGLVNSRFTKLTDTVVRRASLQIEQSS